MRIVMFHTTLPPPGEKPGGVEIVVHRLAEALAARPDSDVTVVSLTGAPPGSTYAHRQLFPRVPGLHRWKPARWFLLPLLLNLVRWPDAEVVHLHGDDWFLLRRPWATVRTFHGSALREAQSATSWRRRTLALLHPLERLSRRLATLSVATDEDTKELVGADRTAPWGVDVERFRPGPKQAGPTVLFVGTWGGRKRGQLVHARFLADVLPRHPDAELWMVTDHSPPPHPSVVHYPAPDDGQLEDLYRRAWVFAYPTTYEGFGLTFLEAMASGTAVVATPSTAATGFLGGDVGRIAPDEELGEAMVAVLDDASLRQRYEQRGRERALASAWAAVAANHRDLFAEAVARVRRRRRG